MDVSCELRLKIVFSFYQECNLIGQGIIIPLQQPTPAQQQQNNTQLLKAPKDLNLLDKDVRLSFTHILRVNSLAFYQNKDQL